MMRPSGKARGMKKTNSPIGPDGEYEPVDPRLTASLAGKVHPLEKRDFEAACHRRGDGSPSAVIRKLVIKYLREPR